MYYNCTIERLHHTLLPGWPSLCQHRLKRRIQVGFLLFNGKVGNFPFQPFPFSVDKSRCQRRGRKAVFLIATTLDFKGIS